MVALVVITGVVFSMMSQSTKASESFAGLKDYKLTKVVNATVDPAQGSGIVLNPGSKTQIDIWEDPQCPYCRMFEESNGNYVDDLIRTKKATVVFHVLSFEGEESVRAANAEFCAADEGRYLDMHKAIYLLQPKLGNSGFYSNANLIKIGGYIGLKSKSFTDCINKASKFDNVKASYDSMAKYKVTGTPTVFINGKLWQAKSASYDNNEFRLAVEAG